jgi:hypothetical protein
MGIAVNEGRIDIKELKKSLVEQGNISQEESDEGEESEEEG